MRQISKAIVPWYDKMGVLACPLCGTGNMDYGNVHLLSVGINAGGRITEANRDAVTTEQGEAEGVGAHVRLRCQCEEDHAFTVLLYFHKGTVFVQYEDVRAVPEDAGVANWPGDLWRD